MFCPRARSILFGQIFGAALVGCTPASPVSLSVSVAGSVRDQSTSTASFENQPREMSILPTDFRVDHPLEKSRTPISQEEIINWSVHGESDDCIIERIKQTGTVFHITTGEKIHLRDAGVSSEVVRAMKGTAD